MRPSGQGPCRPLYVAVGALAVWSDAWAARDSDTKVHPVETPADKLSMAMASNPNLFPGPGASVSAAYANGVQVVSSQWDFTILFFHAVPVPQGDMAAQSSLEQRQVGGIVMSPQHAKALALILAKNVKQWEDQNSAIDLPDEIMRGLTEGQSSSSGTEVRA